MCAIYIHIYICICIYVCVCLSCLCVLVSCMCARSHLRECVQRGSGEAGGKDSVDALKGRGGEPCGLGVRM